MDRKSHELLAATAGDTAIALARVKSWNPGDTLTAADLNAEFNNLLNNPISLVSPTTGAINFQTSVAHTNLTPSAINTTSGSTGGILTISTAGTAVWMGSGIASIVTNNSSTSFALAAGTTTLTDVVGSTMTLSIRSTVSRWLIQGGANVAPQAQTGVNNTVWIQLATSTGVVANSSQSAGPDGVGTGSVSGWSIPFQPVSTASRQLVLQTFQTATSGGVTTIKQWSLSALEIAL